MFIIFLIAQFFVQQSGKIVLDEIPIVVEDEVAAHVKPIHKKQLRELARDVVSNDDRKGCRIVIRNNCVPGVIVAAVLALPDIRNRTYEIKRWVEFRNKTWPGGRTDTGKSTTCKGDWTVVRRYLIMRVFNIDGVEVRLVVGDSVSYNEVRRVLVAFRGDVRFRPGLLPKNSKKPAITSVWKVKREDDEIVVETRESDLSGTIYYCRWKGGLLEIQRTAGYIH